MSKKQNKILEALDIFAQFVLIAMCVLIILSWDIHKRIYQNKNVFENTPLYGVSEEFRIIKKDGRWENEDIIRYVNQYRKKKYPNYIENPEEVYVTKTEFDNVMNEMSRWRYYCLPNKPKSEETCSLFVFDNSETFPGKIYYKIDRTKAIGYMRRGLKEEYQKLVEVDDLWSFWAKWVLPELLGNDTYGYIEGLNFYTAPKDLKIPNEAPKAPVEEAPQTSSSVPLSYMDFEKNLRSVDLNEDLRNVQQFIKGIEVLDFKSAEIIFWFFLGLSIFVALLGIPAGGSGDDGSMIACFIIAGIFPLCFAVCTSVAGLNWIRIIYQKRNDPNYSNQVESLMETTGITSKYLEEIQWIVVGILIWIGIGLIFSIIYVRFRKNQVQEVGPTPAPSKPATTTPKAAIATSKADTTHPKADTIPPKPATAPPKTVTAPTKPTTTKTKTDMVPFNPPLAAQPKPTTATPKTVTAPSKSGSNINTKALQPPSGKLNSDPKPGSVAARIAALQGSTGKKS